MSADSAEGQIETRDSGRGGASERLSEARESRKMEINESVGRKIRKKGDFRELGTLQPEGQRLTMEEEEQVKDE